MTGTSPMRELLDESVTEVEPRSDLASSTLTRARSQRRRRVAAGGSALAVAAIVLGTVAVTQPFASDGTPDPNDVASQLPTPGADGTVALTLDVPRGDEDQVGWVQGTTLHLESDAEVELPKAYDQVVSYQGGYLGADASAGTIDNVQGGEVVATFPGSGLLASPDGIFVAWFEESELNGGRILIRFADGPERGYAVSTVQIPKGETATPVAFRDQGVLYQTDDTSDGDRTVWFSEGDRGIKIDGASAVGGYDRMTDQAVVQTKVTDDGSCWSTYAFPGGEFAGALTEQTCNFSLGEFSADGKYLIGWPAYADGWGPGEVAILDAGTFEPVVQFDSGKDYGVWDAVWDADSLLAPVYLEGSWQVLHLGAGGSMTAVSDPVQADDVSNPFRFAQVGCCVTIVD